MLTPSELASLKQGLIETADYAQKAFQRLDQQSVQPRQHGERSKGD